MIFKGTIEQVLNGNKTQTRRPVKEGETFNPASWALVRNPNGRMKWVVGETYSVQPGRGKKSVGRIRIHHIRHERLQDISDADLLAEGIEFDYVGRDQLKIRRRAFINLWKSLYPKEYKWENNPEVWILNFQFIEGSEIINKAINRIEENDR